jgi:hypothetical protein
MTDDYNTFTDRFARNCAVRRAEQEEWQREEEQRRAQPPQQPQSSYQLPLTDAELDRRIDDRIAKAVREVIGPYISRALDALVDEINKATGDLREALASECEKNAGLHSEIAGLRQDNNGLRDEIGGLRAELTIMRSINASRNVFGVVRKEAKGNVA